MLVALAGGYAGWWVHIERGKISGYRHVQRNFYGMLRIQDEGDFADQTRVRQLLNGQRIAAVLAAKEGFRSAEVCRAVDDPELVVLRMDWDTVGSYRRALSAYDVKVAVVPVISRSSRWMRSSSSRWCTVTPASSATPAYFSGSSVTMTSFFTPSLVRLYWICSTEWPSARSPTCWPPVMATASL